MSSELPKIERIKNTTLKAAAEEGKEKLNNNQSQETAETASAFLSPENQSIWGRMSEGGKKIASQAYEGLYKIPGVNRVVGKMEIAYNQFWVDRHEEKAVQFKNQMYGLDLKAGAFERSKKEIESVIVDLESQNIPGVVESLQLKIKVIEQKKINLLNDKNKAQSKFETREKKAELYTKERDRVADKLIGSYNEKLEPMEKELENLQTCEDQADLVIAVTEVKHKEQEAKLDGIEKRKKQVEAVLRRTGMSEKEIRKFEAVKTLDGFLNQGRENIRLERENLAEKKAEINAKIAKVDAKANPYRDKQKEFARVKERRPLKINAPTGEREQEFNGREETTLETKNKTVGEDKERLKTLENYIPAWNSYLKEKHDKILPGELIDLKDFLESTRLSAEHKLDFEDFKNILTKYYKLKKIPANKLNESIDEFFAKKVKVEK